MLAELAAMSLTLARDLQNRAMEAESSEEAARLAAAFHQVSRGLRQTLALELKVIRYKDEQAREAAATAKDAAAAEQLVAETHARAVADRREAIGERAREAIWTETETLEDFEVEDHGFDYPDDPERADAELEAWLDAAVRRADFLRADIDLLVIEACEAVGAEPRILYDIRDVPAPAEPAGARPAAEPAQPLEPANSS